MFAHNHDAVVLEQSPLREIYNRLIPLVVANVAWWRERVRRWAMAVPRNSANTPLLPIPLRGRIDDGEKVAVLAAIYDFHAAEAAQINPWCQDLALSDNVNLDEFNRKDFEKDIRGYGPYSSLIDYVPSLKINWSADKAAIELFLADAERMISETEAPGQEAREVPIAFCDHKGGWVKYKNTEHPFKSVGDVEAFKALIEAKGQPVGLGPFLGGKKARDFYDALPAKLKSIIVKAPGNKGYRLTVFD